MKSITFNMRIDEEYLSSFSSYLDSLLSAANAYAYEYDFKLCDSDDGLGVKRFVDNEEVKK